MARTSLEDLYDAPSPATSQPTPPDSEPAIEAAEPVAEAPAVQAEDTGDRGTPPASSAPPAQVDDLPADVKGLQAALKAERAKRQEFGTKVTDYEKQLSAAVQEAKENKALLQRFMQQQPQPQERQAPPQPQKPAVPDPLLDPEAAFAYQSQLFSKALSERDQQIIDTRIILSQELMRSKADYDEMETIFAEEAEAAAARGDFTLRQKLISHPLPAKFAYEEGRRIKLARDMGDDPEKYIQSRVEASLAEILAKQAAEAAPQVPTVPTRNAPPPQSLAGVPSTAPRSRAVFTGPTPLDQLYKS